MSGPGLIAEYLSALSRQLPGAVVEELSDGLEETYRRHVTLGLRPEAAARAAVAEFGDPRVIAAEFIRTHPARRAARRLLAAGPVVGSCWAVALIAGRAWTWPVPVIAAIVPGLALLTVAALLAVAAFGGRYRATGRAGTAGCVGTIALDASLIVAVAVTDPVITWAAVAAMTVSAIRVGFSARLLRPVLHSSGGAGSDG
jgi:HAAS domain-containing protein